MASVMTPIGVLYFPAFHAPKVNRQNPNQGARFSGMLLFDKLATESSAFAALKAGIRAAIAEELGEAKANDEKVLRGLRSPIRPASEKTYDGFEDGVAFISAWSKAEQQPGTVDLQGQAILVPGDVFSGQLARFFVRPFFYDNNGNKGVSLYLEHVQIVKADMPRRDGKQSATAAFANVGEDDQMRALGILPGVPAAGPAGVLPF